MTEPVYVYSPIKKFRPYLFLPCCSISVISLSSGTLCCPIKKFSTIFPSAAGTLTAVLPDPKKRTTINKILIDY